VVKNLSDSTVERILDCSKQKRVNGIPYLSTVLRALLEASSQGTLTSRCVRSDEAQIIKLMRGGFPLVTSPGNDGH